VRRTRYPFHRLALAAICAAAAAAAICAGAAGAVLAQTPAPAPRVGQPGKDVLWVPSPKAMVDAMLEMAKVTSSDVVMDLGSGDGRLVIAAARRGAQAIGIEYDTALVELSKRSAAQEGVAARTTFVKADLFTTDLSKATVVLLFLREDLNLKLRPRLLDLRPGTRIVSSTFTMGDWEPDDLAVVHGDCVDLCSVMSWIVPAKVEGVWRMPGSTMSLSQDFQVLSGTTRSDRGRVAKVEGRIGGDHITVVADGARYDGRVIADQIQGTASVGGRTNTWTATRSR